MISDIARSDSMYTIHAREFRWAGQVTLVATFARRDGGTRRQLQVKSGPRRNLTADNLAARALRWHPSERWICYTGVFSVCQASTTLIRCVPDLGSTDPGAGCPSGDRGVIPGLMHRCIDVPGICRTILCRACKRYKGKQRGSSPCELCFCCLTST